jgi:predicted amidohydrolase YtcJ
MKTSFKLLFLMSVMIFMSCNQKEKVDLIISNATIYLVDERFGIADAMAVKDGKIVAAGNNAEITRSYTSDIFLDLDKKPVYPGFIDAHCHFYGYGLGLLKRANLMGTQSFEEILEIMKAHHEKFPSAYWIEGRGWDQNNWPEKAFPVNDKLNDLFPDNPVVLIRVDGHAAIVNDKALQKAGIDVNTKIEGGDVILKNGRPTGVLIDNAIDLVTKNIPPPDKQQMAEALFQAQQNCFAVGLTGVHDCGLEKREIEVIDSLHKSRELKMRIYAMLTPTEETLHEYLGRGIIKNDRLHIRSVKLYADGALGSRGAKLIAEYSDDKGNTGLLLRSPESLRDLCKLAYNQGFQVCTHAIGDSANRLMLDIYGEFLKGKNDLRWRIEHVQIVAPEDFEQFNLFDVVPSVQPTHATSDMYWAVDRVGEERIKGAYAYRDLLDQTGWLPLGTDFPIEGINPIHTFYAAVVRKDLKGWPETGFLPDNALSREEALKGMTIWAAKAAFEENEKGSLEKGKFADFVVLDKDIMIIADIDIPKVKVLKTFLGGEEVFSDFR